MSKEIQAGTNADSSTSDDGTSFSQPCTKHNVVGSQSLKDFLDKLDNLKKGLNSQIEIFVKENFKDKSGFSVISSLEKNSYISFSIDIDSIKNLH